MRFQLGDIVYDVLLYKWGQVFKIEIPAERDPDSRPGQIGIFFDDQSTVFYSISASESDKSGGPDQHTVQYALLFFEQELGGAVHACHHQRQRPAIWDNLAWED